MYLNSVQGHSSGWRIWLRCNNDGKGQTKKYFLLKRLKRSKTIHKLIHQHELNLQPHPPKPCSVGNKLLMGSLVGGKYISFWISLHDYIMLWQWADWPQSMGNTRWTVLNQLIKLQCFHRLILYTVLSPCSPTLSQQPADTPPLHTTSPLYSPSLNQMIWSMVFYVCQSVCLCIWWKF